MRLLNRKALGLIANYAAIWLFSGGVAMAESVIWESPLDQSHLLVGKVFRTADKTVISPEQLVSELLSADFVLLGEKHDNPDHHRLQAWIASELLAKGRGLAVAFEMIDSSRQKLIDAHLAAYPKDANGLGMAVGWEKGWMEWPIYAPIAQAALNAGQSILAANYPMEKARALSRGGRDALDDEAKALGLATPLPEPLASAQKAELKASHCNMLPERALEPMALAQQVRDASMAQILAKAGRAILIAGAGHVRSDYAVPYHLGRVAPGKNIASLALVEVADGQNDPLGYLGESERNPAIFSYLWFTPRLDDNDPCEEFKKPLEKLGGSSLSR
jgi:uncharacterized iron-regulated protein